MEEEEWRQVKGWDSYRVSSYGQVYSKYSNRILAERRDAYGYLMVTFWKDGEEKTYRLHRVVAEHFLPNPSDLPIINHKDGNKSNNYVENLEWCTHSYNTKHMYDIGIRSGKSGEDSTNFKGEVEVLDKFGNLVDTLVGTEDMVKKGYQHTCVYNVLAGRRKTHKGLYFRRKSL